MSKTVTHLDMDDVLSSIKRLVSVKESDAQADDASNEDVLLLTPALRVAEPGDDSTVDLTKEPSDISDLVSEVQARSEQEEAASDAGASSTEDTADVSAQKVEQVAEPTPAPVVLPPQSTAPDAAPNQDQTVQKPKTNLETRIAELEKAIGRTDDSWEPDGSEPQELHHPKLHFLERYRAKYGESGPMPGDNDPIPPVRPPQADDAASPPKAEAPSLDGAADEQANVEDATPSAPIPPKARVFSRSLEPDESADVIALRDAAASLTDGAFEAETEGESPGDAIKPEPVAPEAFTSDAFHSDTAPAVPNETDAVPADAAQVDAVAPTPTTPEEPAQAPRPDSAIKTDETAPDAKEKPLQLGDVAMFVHTPRDAPDAGGTNDAPPQIEADSDEARVQRTIDQLAASRSASIDRPAAQDVVDSDDEFLVDEAVLRKVVADIVKDELQGRLGERITRNVRRMVRQEIEKTLSRKLLD